MKLFVIVVPVCLAATSFSLPARAQSAAPAFVARIHRNYLGQFTGLHTSCIVVHGDGRYRLEDLQQDLGGGPISVKIYLSSLPEAMLSRLRAILDAESFAEIKAPVNNDQIISSVDSISVTVPRKVGTQSFTFLDADSRKPYQKSLKPLFDWFRDVQKRKVSPQKGGSSNKCTE